LTTPDTLLRAFLCGIIVLHYATMDLHLDNIVRLRKPHPCGGYEWRVVRLGADIGAVCTTCGRRVMMPRSKFEKQVKQIVQCASGAGDRLPN
jgi:hypothetical protein